MPSLFHDFFQHFIYYLGIVYFIEQDPTIKQDNSSDIEEKEDEPEAFLFRASGGFFVGYVERQSKRLEAEKAPI